MDSVALWDENNSGDEDRVQRKIIRDQSNIMGLSDKSFVKNFRLSKEAFMYVLNSIEWELKAATRSTAIPNILKLSTTLKFLAQGGYQHQIGEDRHAGLAQQTVPRCLFEVCTAIEKVLCAKHITIKMTEREKADAKRFFYMKCSIPGVIGAVHGTHIQMIRPSKNEHLYFNRKLKHSMNAMMICDHKMKIRAVNGRFAGASHDSHVWGLSRERQFLKENYENGDKGTRILGDSGYPLEPWLMTPFRNDNENSPESYYNEQHSKARSIIERAFGLLKARFRCLLSARELHYAPEKVVQIINSCCALHNICIEYNVQPPSNIPNLEDEISSTLSTDATEESNIATIARNIREEIKNSMFS